VVADAARAGGMPVLGFVDDGVTAGTTRDGLPVLGGRAWLAAQPQKAGILLGLGDNALRERVATDLRAAGHPLPAVIHPRAVVSPLAQLGEAVVVFALAVINTGAVVEDGVIVNTGAVIEHDVRLGRFAHVSPNATLAGGAAVGRRAHVGAGACLLPLRSLGDDSVLGAGGVLVKDVGAGTVVMGVPAGPRRTR
jgi:UDP-N-acetylbacillosamine N-acetyltransferase